MEERASKTNCSGKSDEGAVRSGRISDNCPSQTIDQTTGWSGQCIRQLSKLDNKSDNWLKWTAQCSLYYVDSWLNKTNNQTTVLAN